MIPASLGMPFGGVERMASILLRSFWIALVATLAAGVFAPSASAQDAPAGSLSSASKRIERGDIIRVDVAGRQDLSGLYNVDTNGMITLPMVGAVNASGRTVSDLTSDLSRRYSLIDRDILRVTASLAEYRTGKIYVLGGVVRPGGYTFTEMPNVWDAIAEAGGATQDAILTAVEVIPADSKSGRAARAIDVAAAMQAGRLDKLERLRPGDTVRIPRTSAPGTVDSNVVYIFGAIVTPGAHPYAPDLVTALIRAGGPSPDANLRNVEIVRKSGLGVLSLKIDMRNYLGRGDLSGNPALQTGDTVYLPRLRASSRATTFLAVLAPLAALVTSIVVLTR